MNENKDAGQRLTAPPRGGEMNQSAQSFPSSFDPRKKDSFFLSFLILLLFFLCSSYFSQISTLERNREKERKRGREEECERRDIFQCNDIGLRFLKIVTNNPLHVFYLQQTFSRKFFLFLQKLPKLISEN